jgi:hypothetical protein
MQLRTARWLLPICLLMAGVGTVAWAWVLGRHVQSLDTAARRTFGLFDRIDDRLDRFASLELDYATSGSADSTTLRSASHELQLVLVESSAVLEQAAAADSQPAAAMWKPAADIGEALRHGQENLDVGLDVMAADLVFTETALARRDLRTSLHALRDSEFDRLAEARAAAVTQAWAALATLALLVAWALLRWSRVPRSVSDTRGVVTTVPGEIPLHPPVSQASALDVDLPATAELCTDIARLEAAAGVQGLLERAAGVLRAPGVVLWMAAGEELFPVAAHGYDLAHLRGLGPIDRSATNATAAAWRDGRLQIVGAEIDGRAAVVAPLLAPGRCVGVLAVEILSPREIEPTVQSVASLIAAQLASVLTAWPAASTAPPATIVPFDHATAVSP